MGGHPLLSNTLLEILVVGFKKHNVLNPMNPNFGLASHFFVAKTFSQI